MVDSNANIARARRSAKKPWGILGDIEFELAHSPRSFSFGESSEYGEIDKIEGKPGVQYLGESLQTLDLGFRFQSGWCEPDQQLKRLQKARKQHEPMELTLGTSRFQASYLILDIKTTLQHTDLDGKIVTLECSVKLKEVVVQKKKVSRNVFSPFLRTQKNG